VVSRLGAAAALCNRCLAFGVDLDKVGPEMADDLGEVCNMVAGNFNNKIAGLAEGCMLSPPPAITGSDDDLQSLSSSPVLELRLWFEDLPVVISVFLGRFKTRSAPSQSRSGESREQTPTPGAAGSGCNRP
jgi:chemotaxis protein CheX